MIGIQTGLETNDLSFHEQEPFNFIITYTPKHTGTNLTDKKQVADYFLACTLRPDENGEYKRNKESVISKGLISIDIDDIEGMTEWELKVMINKHLTDYNYYLYPTFSATEENPRFRLIIQPSRDLTPEEYKIMIKKITELIGLPHDSTSESPSQLQGLPVINENNKSIQSVINVTGVTYPIPNNIKQDDKYQSQSGKFRSKNYRQLKYYDYDTVVNAVKGYLELNQDILKEYNESLIFIFRTAEAVQQGVIDEETAIEAVKMLAMGDKNWENDNIRKLQQEIVNPNLNNPIGFVEMINLFGKGFEPQCMDDVFDLLSNKTRRFKESLSESQQKKTLDPYDVSNILVSTVRFVLLGNDEDKAPLYFYNMDKGVYDNSETMIFRMIKAVEPRYNIPQWKNVIGHLRTESRLESKSQNPYLIACNNGIYNVETGKLMDFSPDIYIDSKLKTNYNPEAESPDYFDIDEWIKIISNHDEEVETLLWQVINEAINPNHTRDAIGFLIGEGGSGKGTFQKLLSNLIGKENVATLKPPHFSERFKTSNLLGKVCNIGDDISNKYIDEISDLMSIATGDDITVEEKNKPSYSVTLKLFCLFSGNAMPRVRNKSEGWYRRLLLIPFECDFRGSNKDPKIKDVYMADTKVLEYVLKKAINLRFEKFIIPKVVEEKVDEYRKENDYMLTFIEDEFVAEGLDKMDLSTKDIKDRLDRFLDDSGSNIKVPYHWVNEFVSKLERITGDKYTKRRVRQGNNQITIIERVPTPED